MRNSWGLLGRLRGRGWIGGWSEVGRLEMRIVWLGILVARSRLELRKLSKLDVGIQHVRLDSIRGQ